ncbi:DpnI domain-containing protein [Brevundimonas sp.]|uniref:DpnI domain-containing protein n=1 Tax=Brevundimonas sp. TaxID=1871086 RepID=UPI003A101B6D
MPNNSPVADFRCDACDACDACDEEYEVKAKRGKLGRSISDGTFSTMTARLGAANNPASSPSTPRP